MNLLKNPKFKPLFALSLVIVLSVGLFATVFASGQSELNISDFDNGKPFVYQNTYLEITQDVSNVVKVKGTTEKNIRDNTIILSLGAKSYSLFVNPDGSITEQKFILDVPYCQASHNFFEVNVSYITDNGLFQSKTGYIFGAVTYNENNGYLGYPTGAKYINESGNEVLLETNGSLPDDIAIANDYTVQILFKDRKIITKINSVIYENTPSIEECLGGLYSRTSSSLTVYANNDLEYNLSSDNMEICEWTRTTNGLITFEGLKPGKAYTLIARTPAQGSIKLPSVYVSVIVHSTLVGEDNIAKKAFDDKFNQLKPSLYDDTTGKVTAKNKDISELLDMYNALPDTVKNLPEETEKEVIISASKYVSDNEYIFGKSEPDSKDKPFIDDAISEFNALPENIKSLVSEKMTELADKEKSVALKELLSLEGADTKFDSVENTVNTYKKKINELEIKDGTETDSLLADAAKDILLAVRKEYLKPFETLYSEIKADEKFKAFTDEAKTDFENAYTRAKNRVSAAETVEEIIKTSDEGIPDLKQAKGKAELKSYLVSSDSAKVKALANTAYIEIDTKTEFSDIDAVIIKTKDLIDRQRAKDRITEYLDTLSIPQGHESMINDIVNAAFKIIDTTENKDILNITVERCKAELRLSEYYLILLEQNKGSGEIHDAIVENLDSAYVSALGKIRAAQSVKEISVALDKGLKTLDAAVDSAFITAFYKKNKAVLEKPNVEIQDLESINRVLAEIRTFTEAQQEVLDNYRNILLNKKKIALSLKLESMKDDFNTKWIDKYIEKIKSVSADGDTSADIKADSTLNGVLKEANGVLEFYSIIKEKIEETENLTKDNKHLTQVCKETIEKLKSLDFSPEKFLSDNEYFLKVTNECDTILKTVHKALEFEELRKDYINKLKNDIEIRLSSGKYSDKGIASLNSSLELALAEIDEIYFPQDNPVQVFDKIYLKYYEIFSSVKIVRLTTESGACEILNPNGMNSFLEIQISDSEKSYNSENFYTLVKNPVYRVITGTMTDEEAVKSFTDKNILNVFDITLRQSENDNYILEISDSGVFTVKIKVPKEIRSKSGIQVVTLNEGVIEICKTYFEGDFLVFETTHFSEYLVLSDIIINLTWLAVLFTIILVGEITANIIIFFNRKKKKAQYAKIAKEEEERQSNDETNLYSIFPFLAVLVTPKGIIPSVIVLGILTIGGGALLVKQIIDAKKEADAAKIHYPEITEDIVPTEEDLNAVAEDTELEETPEPEEIPEKTEEKKEETPETPKSDDTEETEDTDDETDEDEYSDIDDAKVKETKNFEDPEEEVRRNKINIDGNGGENFGDFDEHDGDIPPRLHQKEVDTFSLEEGYAVPSNPSDKLTKDKKVVILPLKSPKEKITENEEENQSESINPKETEEISYENQDSPYTQNVIAGVEADNSNENQNKAKIVNVFAGDISNRNNDDDSQDDTDQTDDDEETDGLPQILPDDSDEEKAIDKTVFSNNGNKVYVTHNYSFEAKLLMATEESARRYTYISELLRSYGLNWRRSWKKERYYKNGTNYAQMIFRGKTLCICLAIKPESLEGSKYYYENVSSIKKYENVPVLVRILSGRRFKYAIELINMMMEAAGLNKKYEPSDEFSPFETYTKAELIEKGLIKRMITNGDGEEVTADFEAMKNFKFSVDEGLPILPKVTAEEAALIPDDKASDFVETEQTEGSEQVYGRRKGIINIDTISQNFKKGETVTLKSLKEKHLIPRNIRYIKVLARGTLDKSLTVKAHDFSMDAVKMIIMADGHVIKLKFTEM